MIEEVDEKVEDWEEIFVDYKKEGERIVKKDSSDDNKNRVVFTFPFTDSNHAQVICKALDADGELKPHIVSRIMEVCNENELKVTFDSEDLKQLRSSITAFMENFKLAVESVMTFDPNLKEHSRYDLNDPEIEILATPTTEGKSEKKEKGEEEEK